VHDEAALLVAKFWVDIGTVDGAVAACGIARAKLKAFGVVHLAQTDADSPVPILHLGVTPKTKVRVAIQ
jgi:hypothetical protein